MNATNALCFFYSDTESIVAQKCEQLVRSFLCRSSLAQAQQQQALRTVATFNKVHAIGDQKSRVFFCDDTIITPLVAPDVGERILPDITRTAQEIHRECARCQVMLPKSSNDASNYEAMCCALLALSLRQPNIWKVVAEPSTTRRILDQQEDATNEANGDEEEGTRCKKAAQKEASKHASPLIRVDGKHGVVLKMSGLLLGGCDVRLSEITKFAMRVQNQCSASVARSRVAVESTCNVQGAGKEEQEDEEETKRDDTQSAAQDTPSNANEPTVNRNDTINDQLEHDISLNQLAFIDRVESFAAQPPSAGEFGAVCAALAAPQHRSSKSNSQTYALRLDEKSSSTKKHPRDFDSTGGDSADAENESLLGFYAKAATETWPASPPNEDKEGNTSPGSKKSRTGKGQGVTAATAKKRRVTTTRTACSGARGILLREAAPVVSMDEIPLVQQQKQRQQEAKRKSAKRSNTLIWTAEKVNSLINECCVALAGNDDTATASLELEDIARISAFSGESFVFELPVGFGAEATRLVESLQSTRCRVCELREGHISPRRHHNNLPSKRAKSSKKMKKAGHPIQQNVPAHLRNEPLYACTRCRNPYHAKCIFPPRTEFKRGFVCNECHLKRLVATEVITNARSLEDYGVCHDPSLCRTSVSQQRPAQIVVSSRNATPASSEQRHSPGETTGGRRESATVLVVSEGIEWGWMLTTPAPVGSKSRSRR